VVVLRLGTTLAIPGWATFSTGILIVIFFQAFLMSTIFAFITLQGRSALGFLPIRDHAYFVDRMERIVVEDPAAVGPSQRPESDRSDSASESWAFRP
jgi:hypothetical protein